MLEALLHSGLGEVVAVVTRYYGGVKLGKGGLQRAYAGGVNLALEEAPRAVRVFRVGHRVRIDYGARDAVVRGLDALDGVVEEEVYARDVMLRVAVPEQAVDGLRRLVAEVTSGKGDVHPVDGIAE